MPIKVTGDLLTNAQNMTQVERDALLIEIYQDVTAQHVKTSFIHDVMRKLDELVANLVANPPGGLMGKMMGGMMGGMPERPASGIVLPPPPGR